jgi:hypothetical protein
MFGGGVLATAPKPEWSAIARGIEELLRPSLHRDGRWHMDYVRLRVVAEFSPSE